MRTQFRWALTILAVMMTAPRVSAQQAWQWMQNLDEARSIAAQSNRLVLVHFTAPSCIPCQKLERDVFSQPGFGNPLAADYVGVLVNAQLYASTARQFGVETVPTDVIMTPQGQPIDRINSPQTSAGYTTVMSQIAAEYRRQIAAGPARSERPAVTYGAVSASAPGTSQPPAYASNETAEHAATQFAGNPSGFAASPSPPSANWWQADAASAPPQRQLAAAPQPAGVAPTQGAVAVAPSQSAVGVIARQTVKQEQLPPGSPPLALDGYCPVALVEQQRWLPGDVHFGLRHEGRTYLFSSAADRDKFWSQPHRYAPVMAGSDPVLATDRGQAIPGRREHGLFVNGRVYLFASEETLGQFERDRDRYVQSVNRPLR